MIEVKLDRRALLLGLVAGAATLAVPISSAIAQERFVSRIRVRSGAGIILRPVAGYVADELADQLGSSYRPGAKGGISIDVTLTTMLLPTRDEATDDWGPGFGLRMPRMAVDTLGSRVEITRGGKVVERFPFHATKNAGFRPPFYDLNRDPERERALARAYAYWLIKKLQ